MNYAYLINISTNLFEYNIVWVVYLFANDGANRSSYDKRQSAQNHQ